MKVVCVAEKWARYADQITEVRVTACRKTPKKPYVCHQKTILKIALVKNAPTISTTKANYRARLNKTTPESSL